MNDPRKRIMMNFADQFEDFNKGNKVIKTVNTKKNEQPVGR